MSKYRIAAIYYSTPPVMQDLQILQKNVQHFAMQKEG